MTPLRRHFKAGGVLLDQQDGRALPLDFSQPLEHQIGQHRRQVRATARQASAISENSSWRGRWRASAARRPTACRQPARGARRAAETMHRRPRAPAAAGIGARAEMKLTIRLSSTVRFGNTRRPSGTWEMPARATSCGDMPTRLVALRRHAAAARRNQPGNRAQDAGLAGAVGAEQHEHRAFIDRERDVAHGEQIAVGHAEVFDGKQAHRSAFCLVPR